VAKAHGDLPTEIFIKSQIPP